MLKKLWPLLLEMLLKIVKFEIEDTFSCLPIGRCNSMNLPLVISVFWKACKFDFEDGISGWIRSGTVFNNQPTYGDNPTARTRQPANQQGDWWIGGYEHRPSKETPAGQIQGDVPQGNLTSPCFYIKGNNLNFLLGGGCDLNLVRAELIVSNQASIISNFFSFTLSALGTNTCLLCSWCFKVHNYVHITKKKHDGLFAAFLARKYTWSYNPEQK